VKEDLMAEPLIKWSDTYDLGLEEIDEQHRSLLDLINKIWQAIVDRSDKSVVFGLLEELEKYTLAHFVAEETFMRVTDYPGFPEHKVEHQKFVARIAVEKKRALLGESLSLDLMHFLRDWLVDHILVSDREYANFIEKAKTKERSLLGRFFSRLF
jgi:hemerythrin